MSQPGFAAGSLGSLALDVVVRLTGGTPTPMVSHDTARRDWVVVE